MSVFVDTCVSSHVKNDNAMFSIRRGHFIQNVMVITSTHGEVLEMPCVNRKEDLWSKVKICWQASFLLHDKELFTLCRRQRLPPPGVPVPEMTEDPFGSSGSRHTAASDSRGHRDRQQTRQLRKDFTLLFSIINEQQSQQIRIEGGWGLPVCCSGARRSTLGLTTKCYTPTVLLKCDFA